MIRFEKITKNYPFKGGIYQALRGISFEIAQGEFVSIVGPSGCGKTTILNIVGFLDVLTSGKYFFKGMDVSGFSDYKRTTLRRKEIGFVFQSFNLLPRLTTIENIILPALYLNTERKSAISKATQLLEWSGLKDKSKTSVLSLSGGEKQRVAIARALINSPSVLLADEPTGNLDSKNATEIINFLKELNKNKKMTILMVTHDMSLSKLSDRVIKIKDGNIDENN
jgi:putative ABC transport system ATP-binding protein